ncbi:hypothetical protein HDU99_002731 [Rhizoclosmatium hyalinum]|nr:hypothetical protein HDU99_002731 [Rhizoclosmatium hyalinum]
MQSITNKLPKPILSLVFSFVESPSELVQTCSQMWTIGRNDVVRMAWLRHNAAIVDAWATRVSRVCGTTSGSSSSSSSDEGGTKEEALARFPATLLSEAVVALAFDYYATMSINQQQQSNQKTASRSTLVLRALWAHSCARLYADVLFSVLSDAPLTVASRQNSLLNLSAILDDASWRDTLLSAVQLSKENHRIMDQILKKYLEQVTPYIVDASIIAASTGKLRALTLLSETPVGATAIQDRGNEMLRAAASNGHRDLVLYLVGRGGFSGHHDALVKTYRGLHILLEATEKNLLDSAFSSVIEGWMQSGEEDMYPMRWRMAGEMASERNYMDLIRKLLDARTPKQIQDGEMKLKLRNFALAIQNGYPIMGHEILELAAKEEVDASATTIEAGNENMFAGIGSLSSANDRVTLLLKRYCHITDKYLAPQIGLTATDAKQNIAAHRLACIKFICTHYPYFLNTLNKAELKEDLWSASKLGHFEAAKYLAETASIQMDWLDTASTWSLAEVGNQNLVINASDSIPPALAMALFETLGGIWCVGAGGSDAVVTSNDIGALLVAAEASRDATLGRLKVSDYDAASRQISRDVSFLTAFHPRMIVNPEDKMWTKFLDGKLDVADNTNEEGLSWMEPKKAKEDLKELMGSEEVVKNPVNVWRDTMGLKEERENEELSFFLGLGGNLPETAAMSTAEAESARAYHADY